MCCLFNFRMLNQTVLCMYSNTFMAKKNTNTLRISYQLKHSPGVWAWFMYLIWFIMWQQALTLIFVQWIYFLFIAFNNFITASVVHCVHLDLDICTWTFIIMETQVSLSLYLNLEKRNKMMVGSSSHCMHLI